MAGTRVPPPPNFRFALTGDPRSDIASLGQAVREIISYLTQLYNSVRRTVQAVEKIAELEPLTQEISNPPTQAEVQALQAKINEIIVTANTPIGATATQGEQS